MEMLGGFSDLPRTDQQGNRGQGMGEREGGVGCRTVPRGTRSVSEATLQELTFEC